MTVSTFDRTLIFDRELLARRRARAQAIFDPRLFRYVALQLRDRLMPLKMRFSQVLDITPLHTGGLLPILQETAFQRWHMPEQWHICTPEELGKNAARGGKPEGVERAEENCAEKSRSYDLIFSALEGHWVEDLPLFLRQARLLLNPGGLFLCAFWGGKTLQELRHSLLHAESAILGCASPRVIPMVPLEEGARLLQHAGFTLPVADQDTLTVSYPMLSKICHHLRAMGEGNSLHDRRPASRQLFREAEAFYRRTYGDAEGDLPATFQLVTLTGWAPGPGQPTPLPRGSATHKLATALS